MRECKRCGELFDTDRCRACKKAYNASRDKELARARAREYRAKNPEIVAERVINWRKNNPEKIRAYTAKYKEENAEKMKAYREANAEKIRQQQIRYREAYPERRQATSRKYEQAHKFESRVRSLNRTRKLRLSGRLSPDLESKLLVLQKGKCACCGDDLGDNYHMDHIFPLALGGSNTDDNIQLLKARCNISKGARHPVDYMQSKGKLL